jgi:hypothetical protein
MRVGLGYGDRLNPVRDGDPVVLGHIARSTGDPEIRAGLLRAYSNVLNTGQSLDPGLVDRGADTRFARDYLDGLQNMQSQARADNRPDLVAAYDKEEERYLRTMKQEYGDWGRGHDRLYDRDGYQGYEHNEHAAAADRVAQDDPLTFRHGVTTADYLSRKAWDAASEGDVRGTRYVEARRDRYQWENGVPSTLPSPSETFGRYHRSTLCWARFLWF